MLEVVSPVSLVVAFMVTGILLAGLPRLLLRAGVLDPPNPRSLHALATPRGAGLAVGPAALSGVCAAGGGVLRSAAPLLAAGALALMLGLADDVGSMRPATRLVMQTLLAAGSLAVLMADGASLTVFTLVVALFWIVAFTNAFNFMDGINGISAATVIVTGTCWTALARLEQDAVLGTVGAVLAISCLAFLPWNSPRAVIFLGDSGSYFLGATIAVLVVLAGDRGVPLVALVAPLSIYLADTGTTLMRRAARGEKLLQAHRDHVYQRLAVRLGHGPTATIVALASGTTGALGLLAGRAHGGEAVALWAAGLSVCLGYVLSPRILAWRAP